MSLWVSWSDEFTIVSHGIYVMKFITAIVVCVTSTRDLETEGHVMVCVTFVISACIRPTAMIFSLFRKVFRSRNSFQLLPIAWPQRVTLNLKVKSRTTWLFFYLCLYSSYSDDFFVVSWDVLAKEFIPTIANCVTLTCDLESEGHVMDYVTLVISACIRPTAMIFSLFREVYWLRNSFQLLQIAWT